MEMIFFWLKHKSKNMHNIPLAGDFGVAKTAAKEDDFDTFGTRLKEISTIQRKVQRKHNLME
jgi:hypothetical protein